MPPGIKRYADVTKLSPTELTIIGMDDPLHQSWEIVIDPVYGLAAKLKETRCVVVSGFVDNLMLAGGIFYVIEFAISWKENGADSTLKVLVNKNDGDTPTENEFDIQNGYHIYKTDPFKVPSNNFSRTYFHLVNTDYTVKKDLMIYTVKIKKLK